jgi:hypothetical protein
MAYKRLSHYRSGGAAALVDRRSVRRSQRRTLEPQHLQRAVALRHERFSLRRIARLLALPLSNVGRTLKALGLGRLKHLQPPVPLRRYQWERPGNTIRVDIKQLARFDRVGHRITGDRPLGSSPGAGYEKVLVAIDDATRLAYAEVLPDEKQVTTVGFLIRAVAWFGRQGTECWRVLSDNGSAYRSKPWRLAWEAVGLSAMRTRPCTP